MTQRLLPAIVASLLAATACTDRTPTNATGREPAAPPTNRVDIPEAVRANLGMSFATVERRSVAQTLRLPGRFELLPTARREYRAPIEGRVELRVGQFEPVEPGQVLCELDSAAWHDLQQSILALKAKVRSLTPIREAHDVHQKSLDEKVAIWQARLDQLEQLRAAGGGSASAFTEARATLSEAKAEQADLLEKDAELDALQQESESALHALEAKRDYLLAPRGSTRDPAPDAGDAIRTLPIHAVAPGRVESLAAAPGGLVEEHGLIMTVVQPEQLRFVARVTQSDLSRLRDGLATRIVPPTMPSDGASGEMASTLQLGLGAHADDRTLDAYSTPADRAPWARDGASGYLEVTLKGGSEELAIPASAIVRDGATPILFRRDPADPDKAIRLEADLGLSDGRWIVIASGVREGDQVVLAGNYQLMLATSGSAPKGGHFHSDGTFHEGEH